MSQHASSTTFECVASRLLGLARGRPTSSALYKSVWRITFCKRSSEMFLDVRFKQLSVWHSHRSREDTFLGVLGYNCKLSSWIELPFLLAKLTRLLLFKLHYKLLKRLKCFVNSYQNILVKNVACSAALSHEYCYATLDFLTTSKSFIICHAWHP